MLQYGPVSSSYDPLCLIMMPSLLHSGYCGEKGHSRRVAYLANHCDGHRGRYDIALVRLRSLRRLTFHLATGFWDLGHKLFRTTPETYPAKFLAGSAFDDAHLCPTAPMPPGPSPPVESVNTLTELRGHISVIHTSSLFHLFNEVKQFELSQRLAALLDLRPGSIIFGSHGGSPVKGQGGGLFPKMFCHSPESWIEMWEEQIFQKGQVKATAVVVEMKGAAERLGVAPPSEEEAKFHALIWSVTRL